MRAWFWGWVLLAGCTSIGVGDPCEPEVVPEGGYRAAEVYVEASSPQCRTSWCIAHGLEGDPSPGCTGDRCASPEQVREHTYCSCRCGGEGQGEICACPDGFGCREVPLRGSFCVRDLP